MTYTGFFLDTPYKVVDGNIVYASDLNNPMAALKTGIASLVDSIQTGATIQTAVDTGVVNAYKINPTAAPTEYADGLMVWLKPTVTNTGASTIDVSDLGVKTIRSTIRSALVGGELLAGHWHQLKYSGTLGVFEIVSEPGRTDSDTSKTIAGSDGVTVTSDDTTITASLTDGGVSTAKIADGAVTRAKMADDMDVVVHNDIIGGDITVSANTLTITPCGCWDSTRTVWLESTENDAVVIPSTNNLDSDVYIVRIAADSSIDFKSYDHTGAGPAGDATVNAYRRISFSKNDGTGVVMPFVQIEDHIEWITSVMPQITASLTASFVSYGLNTVIPNTVWKLAGIYTVPVSGNTEFSYGGTTVDVTVGNTASGTVLIPSVSSIYARYSAATTAVKIRSIELRR